MNLVDNFIEIKKLKYGTVNLMKEYSYDKTYLDLHKYNTLQNPNIQLDKDGIFKIDIRNEYQYYPVSHAIYALECISKYYIYKEEEYKNTFMKYIDYFIKNQDKNNGGWPIEFNYKYAVVGISELVSPWYSALAQGFIISCMVRAYYLTNNIEYLNSAILGSKIFNIDVKDGGIKGIFLDRYIFYEEYPTTPGTYVLNGFMFSLMGLYDLYMATNNIEVKKLLLDGLETLKECISMYDIGFLSMYDLTNHTTLANPAKYHYGYHLTHCRELSALLCWDIVKSSDAYIVLEKIFNRWLSYADGNMAFFRLREDECVFNILKKYYRVNEVCNISLDYSDKSKEDILYALHIYKDNYTKHIQKYPYSKNNELTYIFKKAGKYKLIAYYKDKFSNISSKTINITVLDTEPFDINDLDVSVTKNLDNLTINLSYKGKYEDLKYAYYLIKDKEAIEKHWYSNDNTHVFNIKDNGIYEIRYFIENEYKERITNITEQYIYDDVTV